MLVEKGPDVGAGDVQGPGSGQVGASVDAGLIGQQRQCAGSVIAAVITGLPALLATQDQLSVPAKSRVAAIRSDLSWANLVRT